MIEYHQIRDVHLEISTICNAACSWCPRNFYGYPYNNGYPETYMTVAQARLIFKKDFMQQLESVQINGNFGDIVMNPEGADVVEYFRANNPDLRIQIHTNGGARSPEFWQRLAKDNAKVFFALDGLEDTHDLYRQNTSWHTVIKNAKIFIAHGGNAVWQMIKFKHNAHQIQTCRDLSLDMGFSRFRLVDEGRNTGPVFDKRGRLVHVLGDYTGELKFNVLFDHRKKSDVLLEDIVDGRVPKSKIQCYTQRFASIFVAANGDVSPCCWTGFYPKTYGRGHYHQAANSQLAPMITKNNALKHSLEECIEWFKAVQLSWNKDSYRDGRLLICDDNCGSDL